MLYALRLDKLRVKLSLLHATYTPKIRTNSGSKLNPIDLVVFGGLSHQILCFHKAVLFLIQVVLWSGDVWYDLRANRYVIQLWDLMWWHLRLQKREVSIYRICVKPLGLANEFFKILSVRVRNSIPVLRQGRKLCFVLITDAIIVSTKLATNSEHLLDRDWLRLVFWGYLTHSNGWSLYW